MKVNNSVKLLEKYIHKFKLNDMFDENLIKHAKLFEFKKGEAICRRDEQIVYGYFLVKGIVKAFTSLENGKEYLFRNEEPLTFFGDVELFRKECYTSYVEGVTEGYIIGISMEVIRKEYSENPRFLHYICNGLAFKLETISSYSSENLYIPLKNKLAGYLCIFYKSSDQPLELTSGFSDIARQLGVTYRHLSRIMKEFEDMSIIKKESRKIWVTDFSELKRIRDDQ